MSGLGEELNPNAVKPRSVSTRGRGAECLPKCTEMFSASSLSRRGIGEIPAGNHASTELRQPTGTMSDGSESLLIRQKSDLLSGVDRLWAKLM